MNTLNENKYLRDDGVWMPRWTERALAMGADRGVIVEHGPPRVFFEAPEDPRTQEFLSQIL